MAQGWRCESYGCTEGTPYNSLYGDSPSEWGLPIWMNRNFNAWSIWKGTEICHYGVFKDPKGLTDGFCGCEKVEVTFWFGLYSYFKGKCIYSRLLRGMQSFKLGMLKGFHYFVDRGYTKRVPFLSELVHKRVRGWSLGGPFPSEMSIR